MALFQRQDKTNPSANLYTFGQEKTVLIVGLGNIGREYHKTRHNIGFACVDAFVHKNGLSEWIEKKDLKCYLSTGHIGDSRVLVIKPTTFMNKSGEAIQATSHFYKISTEQTVVVHDELDVPFGQIRSRNGGSAAGHNGIKSIIQHSGEEFGRIRVGIGAETPITGQNYVLSRFAATEEEQIPHLITESNAILSEYVHSGKLLSDTRTFLV